MTAVRRSQEPVDLMAALRASIEAAKVLCPRCACAKADHGTFGWSGCDRRFPPAAATRSQK